MLRDLGKMSIAGLPAVVVTVILTLSGCQLVSRNYDSAKTRAREDALATALTYTREAIREYTADHGKPPHRLEDLVNSGYFNSIPIDPMTNKADWSVEYHPCDSTPCEKRIKDVHSSSTNTSSKNNPYSEW